MPEEVTALTYLIILARILTILPLALVLTLLVMGKRPVGELPVFDFLVIIAFGAIVGADIADPTVPHLPTAFALVGVAGVQWLTGWARVRWRRVSRALAFEPTVIVYKGNLIARTMKKLNYTIDDVLFQLREKGYFNPAVVEIALVEHSGKLSVLPMAGHAPATANEIGVRPEPRSVPVPLVVDGHVLKENLAAAGLSESQLTEALGAKGIRRMKDAFFAYMDTAGLFQATPYHLPPGLPNPPKMVD